MAEALSSAQSTRLEVGYKGRLQLLKRIGNQRYAKASGLAFSKKGEIFIVNPNNIRIQVFDICGNFSRKITLTGATACLYPSKVAVNPTDGFIYVVQLTSNLGIKMINSSGDYTKTFGEHDDKGGKVRALTVDKKDNVLILEHDKSGSVILSIIDKNEHLQRYELPKTVKTPTDLAAWDEKIYISDYDAEFIEIFDYSGIHVGTFEKITRRAVGVCVSLLGEVFVGAFAYDGLKVIQFTADGTFISFKIIGHYHHDIFDMAMHGPRVVIATSDGVYLFDPRKGQNDVNGSSIERSLMTSHNSFRLGDGFRDLNIHPLSGVSGAAFPDVIYVSNFIRVNNAQYGIIQLFSSAGAYLGEFTTLLTNPKKLVVDRRTNNVLVIDEDPTPHIVIFDNFGTLISRIGTGLLELPKSLAVDRYGRIYVIEHKKRTVKVFDILGSWLDTLNCREISIPTDIAISERKEIYISDFHTHSILVYNYRGEMQRRIGNSSITLLPLFVNIVQEGFIVVATLTLNVLCLTYFTEDGNFVSAHQTTDKHRSCSGISVMSDRSVVVASDWRNFQIYVYYPNWYNTSFLSL